MKQLSALAGIFMLTISASQGQTTVEIPASRDNTIYQESGTQSNGAGSYFFSGSTQSGNRRRALIYFDLSSIPPGAVIEAVELRIRCSRAGSADGGVDLHRLLRSWGEGASDANSQEGSGAAAQTDDATWTVPFFGKADTWTSPGGDFAPAASASRRPIANGELATFSSAGMASDVQAWVNNSATNFGWLLNDGIGGNSSARRFNSRSNTTDPPVLVVRYAGALPVTLSHFEGVAEKSGNLLQWRTSEEINFSHFDVEHSADGLHFQTLAVVPKSSAQKYQYLHTRFLHAAIDHYRLKMIDNDGKSSYSNTIAIKVQSDGAPGLFPVPARNQILISSPVNFAGGSFELMDVGGRSLLRGTITGGLMAVQIGQLVANGQFIVRLISRDGRVEVLRGIRY